MEKEDMNRLNEDELMRHHEELYLGLSTNEFKESRKSLAQLRGKQVHEKNCSIAEKGPVERTLSSSSKVSKISDGARSIEGYENSLQKTHYSDTSQKSANKYFENSIETTMSSSSKVLTLSDGPDSIKDIEKCLQRTNSDRLQNSTSKFSTHVYLEDPKREKEQIFNSNTRHTLKNKTIETHCSNLSLNKAKDNKEAISNAVGTIQHSRHCSQNKTNDGKDADLNFEMSKMSVSSKSSRRSFINSTLSANDFLVKYEIDLQHPTQLYNPLLDGKHEQHYQQPAIGTRMLGPLWPVYGEAAPDTKGPLKADYETAVTPLGLQEPDHSAIEPALHLKNRLRKGHYQSGNMPPIPLWLSPIDGLLARRIDGQMRQLEVTNVYDVTRRSDVTETKPENDVTKDDVVRTDDATEKNCKSRRCWREKAQLLWYRVFPRRHAPVLVDLS